MPVPRPNYWEILVKDLIDNDEHERLIQLYMDMLMLRACPVCGEQKIFDMAHDDYMCPDCRAKSP